MPESLPTSLIAIRLLERLAEAPRGLLFISHSEARASDLADLLNALAPDAAVILLPAWDCLPFDRAPPSREIMGRRMAALRRIAELGDAPKIVLSTPDALMQRLPPQSAVQAAITLRQGQAIDPVEIERKLLAAGYVVDDRIDEAGELAVRGQVLEVYPPADPLPHRLDIAEGLIEAIRSYDPVSQRTRETVESVVLDPASELVLDAPEERFAGAEHWLPTFYGSIRTIFDVLPDAMILQDAKAQARAEAVHDVVREAYADRLRWRREDAEARPPLEPDKLYLAAKEWDVALTDRGATRLEAEDIAPVPQFAAERNPARAFGAFLREEFGAGRTVVIAAAVERDLVDLLHRASRAAKVQARRVDDWSGVPRQASGELLGVLAPARQGFTDEPAGVTLIAAADVLGSRARASADVHAAPPWFSADEEFGIDDLVVHIDHGVGVLRGIETVEAGSAGAQQTLRLEYARQATLLVPVEEIGKVWRYGSDPEAIALDHLNTEGWASRRAKVEAQVAETAKDLTRLAEARAKAAAPKLEPPNGEYERFVARFPFTLTPDQARAVDDVMADLASGRPMDRLVIGDVGYGKTEVAMRAAAAVALAGKQVAIAAPTTVLVRQHVENFRRRFAELGVEVAHLSRLVPPAEAKRVKEGLRSGDIRVVIGTHAVAGKGVELADPGLVVIDEEQRFGTADKRKLRDLARGAHVLTLTATPIPRTLQAALVGLQDLSVIATPPVRRRPIRTFNIAFDDATVRSALLRERRRGGQSFVVVPRIEDIEPVAARLRELVPQLKTRIAHGGMKALEVDEAMVAFSGGDGDVLLATNIVESGLDVPNANTMIVWRADLFGLAQLHQLRGRVGRGRAQGVCYLLSDAKENDPAARRLGTLATLDRLGSGMAISARDLDARGAGDLVGEEQAGHLKLIGPGLYQHLLERALREARGEPVEARDPVLNIGEPGSLPADYIPEPELRINAYSRLARASADEDLDRLTEELVDRFGQLPPQALTLIEAGRLKLMCLRQGVARLDAGPQALAYTFEDEASAERAKAADLPDAEWKKDRLVVHRGSDDPAERLALAVETTGELA